MTWRSDDIWKYKYFSLNWKSSSSHYQKLLNTRIGFEVQIEET